MKKLLFTLTLLSMFTVSAYAEKYAVVVNTDNADASDIKDYFLLNNENWPTVGEVSVYEMSGTPVHEAFLSQVLKMDKGTYDTHWNGRKSAGKTAKPTDVKSASYMHRFIKNKKGAIGYIPEAQSTGLKVVTTFDGP